MPVLSQYLTVQETADKLRVSTRTVRRAIGRGDFPVVRIGSRVVRVPSLELEEFLRSTSATDSPAPTVAPDRRTTSGLG